MQLLADSLSKNSNLPALHKEVGDKGTEDFKSRAFKSGLIIFKVGILGLVRLFVC